MHELVDWLAARSGTTVDDIALPTVRRVATETLLAKAFSYRPSTHQPSGSKHRVRGLYDNSNRIIYIADDIDLGSTDGRAVLLHELVHHLQFMAGHQTDLQCINELEPAAYEIEAEYLASHRQQLDPSIGEIRRLSRCG